MTPQSHFILKPGEIFVNERLFAFRKKVQSSSVKRVHVPAVHTIALSSQLELIDFTLSFE